MGWQDDVEEGAILIDVEDASVQGSYVLLSVGVYVVMHCLLYKGDGVLVGAVCCAQNVEEIVCAARDGGAFVSEFYADYRVQVWCYDIPRRVHYMRCIPEDDLSPRRVGCYAFVVV